jgi:hypothetical protein
MRRPWRVSVRAAHVLGMAVVMASQLGGGAPGAGGRTGSPASGALDQLERSVTRPLPSVPPPPPGRSQRIWVPDRHVPAPDGSAIRVPGHWEYRQPSGEYQRPPLLVCTPDGRCATAPGTDTRIPPEQRQSP